MTAIFEVNERFIEKLFSQFEDSPNITGLIEILSDPMQDMIDVAQYILEHSGIDDAEGELLDWLGEIVGVTRGPLQETKLFTLFRAGEASDIHNDHGFYDSTTDTGGYIGTQKGLTSIDNPEALISDADFRFLIKQKASSFRTKMTRENLFNYLISFGAECVIDDDTDFHAVIIDAVEYDDFNSWTRNYILTRGFKPAGIRTQIQNRLRNKDSV